MIYSLFGFCSLPEVFLKKLLLKSALPPPGGGAGTRALRWDLFSQVNFSEGEDPVSQ